MPVATTKLHLKYAAKNRFMENFILFHNSTLGDYYWNMAKSLNMAKKSLN